MRNTFKPSWTPMPSLIKSLYSMPGQVLMLLPIRWDYFSVINIIVSWISSVWQKPQCSRKSSGFPVIKRDSNSGYPCCGMTLSSLFNHFRPWLFICKIRVIIANRMYVVKNRAEPCAYIKIGVQEELLFSPSSKWHLSLCPSSAVGIRKQCS